jgi:predicted ABC-class ATPase
LFLLDEDTCASNFMIRDSRMRSMISNEPITPFIYRVNSLHKEKGISTIVVIGGSGDWFDVQDTTIMMDNYNCLDVTLKARSICKTFCTGRVQYNGRGLVHQLPWKSPIARAKPQTGMYIHICIHVY